MTAIQANSNVTTVIDVFSVDVEKQQKLIDGMKVLLETQLKQQQGFLFASLHKSIDGVKVTNYMQWTSKDAYDASLVTTDLENINDLFVQRDRNVYEVAFTAGQPTTIQENNNLVTLINVFSVQPEHQQQWVEQLAYVIDPNMRQEPGYLSTNFHRSLDGTKIVNYSQWTSVQEYNAAGDRLQKAVRPSEEFKTLVLQVEPHLYEVVFTINV